MSPRLRSTRWCRTATTTDARRLTRTRGPPGGIPGLGGERERDFPPGGIPGLGGEREREREREEDFGRAGSPFGQGLGETAALNGRLCPPGLAGQGCFPPEAKKFRQGFCPPGLRDKGCMPPGLRVFSGGGFVPVP